MKPRDTHVLDGKLMTRAVKVLLVGAGGTGSRMLEKLVALHRALKAKGHPNGLDVVVVPRRPPKVLHLWPPKLLHPGHGDLTH